MPERDAPAGSEATRAEETRLLRTRVHVGLLITLVALLLYAAGDLGLNRAVLPHVLRLRLLSAAIVFASLGALQARASRAWSIGLTLLALAGILFSTAATGIILRDDATTLLLAIVLVTVSATLFPWGVGPHAVVVAFGVTATLWNLWSIHHGLPLAYAQPAGAILIVLTGSFYVLHDLGRTRRAMTAETLERRRAEAELRASEARFALASRGANDGIWDLDLRTGAAHYSPRWKAMLGYADAEIEPTFDEWRVRVHPDDAERFASELLAHGQSLIPHFQNEHRLRHRDGGYRWMLARGLCVYDQATRTPTRLAGSLTDITDRTRIEDQLLKATADAGAILRAFPDVYVRVNADGTVRDLHSRRQTDLLPGILPGQRIQDALSPELAEQWTAVRREVLATGGLVTREYTLPAPQGDRTFEARILPLRSEQIIIIARDITERRLAEEQARQHHAELAHALRLGAMGEMAAEFAHELNQPLAAIVNYAKGCVRRLQSGAQPDELYQALEHISHEAVRGSEIIRRIRNFVRKDAPRRERIDLNGLVQETVGFAKNEAQRYGIPMRLTLSAQPVEVDGDAIQIEQVILNLLRNGLEAMGEPGQAASGAELEIETATDGNGTVTVSVRDRGKGLPPGLGDRIFDPFVTTKPTGLGMGLSISRSIVESHGGRLWATANADCGTTFAFTIPRPDGDPPHGS